MPDRDYYSEILDEEKHDLDSFSCGVPELDRYLRERAAHDHRRRVAVPHVLVESATGRIIGYYTLSMRSVDRDSFPRSIARKLRYRQIPAAIIGRLGVREDLHGQGWGVRLLANAFARIALAAGDVAAFAVIVEALDENAPSFYEHLGFRPMADDPRALFIPLDSVMNPPEPR